MKTIIAGAVVAIVVAVGAAYVLDNKVQETVQIAFTTGGARI